MTITEDTSVTKAKLVWPFYAYASISFLVACIILMYHSTLLMGHYFQPPLLAITHTMAIGWATMIIFGASFQLLPVIANRKLNSEKAVEWCFWLTAISLPVIIYSFYNFVFGVPFIIAASALIIAVGAFVWNVYKTVCKSNVIQGDYMLSASVYLFITVCFGFLLAFNFSYNLLSENSLSYLKLHAHLGIIGWFLFLIIGVGSKLIPMFVISKYKNDTLIRFLYYVLHISMFVFIINQTLYRDKILEYAAFTGISLVIILFVYFVFQSFKLRIKKKIDITMRAAACSIIILFTLLIFASVSYYSRNNLSIIMSYGFLVFFGWISFLIIGMTFKTLPFIIWNSIYAEVSGKLPSPKELYSEKLFTVMLVVYIVGFVITLLSILLSNTTFLLVSTSMLLLATLLYNVNVFKIILHKSKVHVSK